LSAAGGRFFSEKGWGRERPSSLNFETVSMPCPYTPELAIARIEF